MADPSDFQRTIAEFKARFIHDPVGYARAVHNMEPDDNIKPMFEAVARGDRQVSVASAHGVGKTRGLSLLVSWFANTRWPWVIVMTAPSSSQLYDGLWPQVRARFNELNPLLKDMFTIGMERIALTADPDNCFISPRAARKDQPEAFQGLHSPNLLMLVDEASGVPDEVFEAGRGSMSEKGAHLLLCSNPTRLSGFFFRTQTDPVLRDSWTRIQISGLNSKWVTKEFVSEIVTMYGEDSNQYRVRVLGLFPKSETDVLIDRDLVEAAFIRQIDRPNIRPVWGIDIARYGRDKTVFTPRWGNYVGRQEVWPKEDTMQTAGRVKARWDATPITERPAEILIDVIGVGSGVCDRLREFDDIKTVIRMVNVTETSPANSRGYKLRDHLWLCAFDWFTAKKGYIEGSTELAEELSTPTYDFTSDARYVVESKDAMAKRGHNSPNRADSFNLTFAGSQATLAGNPRGSGAIKSRITVV